MKATPHIEVTEEGKIAKTVLMPGDPLRAEYIAKTYLENVEDLNNEIKMFLVDGYFENIVLDNKRLYKTYYDNSISALTFLKLFRKYLEKIKNQEIKYLSDARDLANTDFGEGRYRRNYSKNRFLLR